MGRELKRVALNFNWPIDMLWKGYVNPYTSQPCKACDSTGLNEATRKLKDDWYAFDNPKWVQVNQNMRYNDNAWQYHLTDHEIKALIKSNRLINFTHDWDKTKRCYVPKSPKYTPTAQEVNDWAKKGIGHDAINQWICVEARAKRLRVWGKCKFCKGDGEIWATPEVKSLSEAWEPFEPPAGKGYQLWSTTTEGHPMTPVFKSLESLCVYCANNNVSTFGYETKTAKQWYEWFTGGPLLAHQEGNILFI